MMKECHNCKYKLSHYSQEPCKSCILKPSSRIDCNWEPERMNEYTISQDVIDWYNKKEVKLITDIADYFGYYDTQQMSGMLDDMY